MNIQFTAELSLRTPISVKEEEEYTDLVKLIKIALANGILSSLFFFEDQIDKRDLQNAFLKNQSFLKDKPTGLFKRSYPLPIGRDSFHFDQNGKILSLNIEGIKSIEHSCIYLLFNRAVFKSEVLQSFEEEDSTDVLKTSPIFWEVFDSFTQELTL